jgi:hypothetical protein
VNFLLQWLFWISALIGLLLGLRVGLSVSWTMGLATIIVTVGVLMPLGNHFKTRREIARSRQQS